MGIDLEKLKDLSLAKEVRKGTIIIKANDSETPPNMYVILKGHVTVNKNFNQRDAVQLAKLGPGSFVGEMSLFLSEPRSATVVTVEECVVLEITQSNAFEVLSNHPEFTYSMMVALCERVRDTSKKV